MKIANHTELSTQRIEAMIRRATAGWNAPTLVVNVRYSRGAVYSGTFASSPVRIFVNLGRDNEYPLRVDTAIARARTVGQSWWKPTFYIRVTDAYQLTMFVFLHEFYHYLVHRAKRNNRCKEAMCDRYAVRYLVDNCRLAVYDSTANTVARDAWLFQDLDRFVAPQQKQSAKRSAARRPRTGRRSK